ncbi:Alpha/Beta hydrolase protein [Gamsiella multidivaricata]|uniref:Alpha/Beta hydrolase protein n=1 Tax=Gamsiella multidivaricata TaxID=101098 RepID=UPI00221E63CF|nr:Alpha/Beta hydrolase protein [Gamsiella multidivaricata]KAI7827180.1 Alpha/Beta hydrolase protein [Gamsiella multidivaricata]
MKTSDRPIQGNCHLFLFLYLFFPPSCFSRPNLNVIFSFNVCRLAWAFWAAPIEEVFESTSDMMDLNGMVDTLEETKEIKFAEGYNAEVECIRLAFDPVVASHRPLIYYALVWIGNTVTGLIFHLLGFARFEGTVIQTHAFEKAARQGHAVDPTTDISYWHRSLADPQNKVPLVFIHGIGIGLVQYIHWVIALSTLSRPIIVIEVPYVSNNLFQRDCMTPDESYFAIERILKAHGYPKATFMGHSLGTMLCAAICRANSASSPKSIVKGLILADPICFLTHHSIARNFAYRVPSTASELIMDLFAAREIGTSWYIMRRFCWDQCIMFPISWRRRLEQKPLPLQGRLSPVLPKMTRVFLSRKDNLLDMDLIAEYLRTQVGLREDKEELHIMENMDHAAFLLRPAWFWKVLKAAQEC